MLTPLQAALAAMLPDLGILDWSRMFILKNGKESPIYANWRRLRGDTDAMLAAAAAGEELMKLSGVKTLNFDHLGDVPTGVTPFVATLSYRMRTPQITPHPPKSHGAESSVDGIYRQREVV